MGYGLKPSFKATCPKCNFVLKYYVRDPQAHPDSWVLNSDSLQHLKEAHIVVPEVRKTRIFRSFRRLPSSRRRALV